MHDEDLPRIDRLGGSLARKSVQRVRRITDRIANRISRRGEEDGAPAADRKALARARKARRTLRLERAPERILVVKLWGLGNLVLAGRALTSLRRAYPNARTTLLTTPRCVQIYEKNNLYDTTVVFDPDEGRSLGSAMNELCERLAGEGFDLAVNLEGLSELARHVTLQSGAAATVGFAPEGEGCGPYDAAAPFLAGCHVEDLLYEVARVAGGKKVGAGLVAPSVRGQERGYCDEVLNRLELDPHALLVGIDANAGGFAPERQWPIEKFALLAQRIEAEPEFRTLFFGGPREERRVAQAVKLMAEPGINVAGLFSIRQTMAFLERLHLFIGNDAGPAHLAAALGVPTVVIYGPESPARVGRRGDERHAAVYHARDCSPCVSLLGMERRPCAHGAKCVREIPVEEVYGVVRDVLDHLSDPDDPPWLAS
ncbi:MAG: glycosyltransferase family 9 protein [Planctomycetota bacterium]